MTRICIDPASFLRLARGDRSLHPSHQLVAPNSLRTRALELLLHEVQAGALDEAEALRGHDRLTELKVRLLGDRVSRRVAFQHALRSGWPDLADAEYLAVAQLQADVLVTDDERLAARAVGVVPVADFERLFRA